MQHKDLLLAACHWQTTLDLVAVPDKGSHLDNDGSFIEGLQHCLSALQGLDGIEGIKHQHLWVMLLELYERFSPRCKGDGHRQSLDEFAR